MTKIGKYTYLAENHMQLRICNMWSDFIFSIF